MQFYMSHTTFAFGWLELAAALVLAGVVIYTVVQLKRLKKQEQVLEERLAAAEAKAKSKA